MLTLSSPPLYKLIESLNEDLSTNIPELNSGGCGIFASFMYKKLKSLGYNPVICIIDGDEEEVEYKKDILNKVSNNLCEVKAWEKRETSFAHCYLEVDGIIFDGLKNGSSIFNSFYQYKKSGNYTIEELDLCLKVAGWNKTFKRRKRNPTLRASINRAVKEVYNTKIC